jgi:hypothetical protein
VSDATAHAANLQDAQGPQGIDAFVAGANEVSAGVASQP